ncbi:hypothetical protein [Actinomadura sp. KC345]|uniref:hypothetical protein n=1 Tax=Actinomadura sp. KC345 TaxID=2530371 RepID=UPI0014045CF6|nr:hypothetical protein [Actinomadura sp. KC345]
MVLFLVCLARIGVAAGHLKWTWTRVLRVVICPVVLLGSFLNEHWSLGVQD